jgi:hypothetical protein
MNHYIAIRVNGSTFSGYEYLLPKFRLRSLTDDEIVGELKNSMKDFFQTHKLHRLRKKVDSYNYVLSRDLEAQMIWVDAVKKPRYEFTDVDDEDSLHLLRSV